LNGVLNVSVPDGIAPMLAAADDAGAADLYPAARAGDRALFDERDGDSVPCDWFQMMRCSIASVGGRRW
jgi:hypothetical protein